MNINDCRGCFTLKDDNRECLWFHKDIGQCPCPTCLIKMVCVSPCDLLHKHSSKIRRSTWT